MKTLFNNWHLMRILRFSFAIFLFTQAYYSSSLIFLSFGLFFFIQSIFNLGFKPDSDAKEIKK